MSKKRMRGPRELGAGGEAAKANAFIHAIQRLAKGQGGSEDFETMLVGLADEVGYYDLPTLGDWMKTHKTAAGYELACAIRVARCQVVEIILKSANLSDEKLVALERAAIHERALLRSK